MPLMAPSGLMVLPPSFGMTFIATPPVSDSADRPPVSRLIFLHTGLVHEVVPVRTAARVDHVVVFAMCDVVVARHLVKR